MLELQKKSSSVAACNPQRKRIIYVQKKEPPEKEPSEKLNTENE